MYVVCSHRYVSIPYALPCGSVKREQTLCLEPQMFSILSKHQAPVEPQPTRRPGAKYSHLHFL